MNNRDKLEKIKKKWNDSYFILLGIFDHLNECLWIYQEYKTTKHSDNLYKELADLYILLKIFFEDGKIYFYDNRLDRFIEKLEEKKGSDNK